MTLSPIRTSRTSFPLTATASISTAARLMSHTEALDLASKWAYSRQRSINSSHVTYLSQCMTAGELTFIEIHLGVLNGQEYIVDGQHRLHALAKTDLTLPAVVILHDVSTEQELAGLYAKYDRGRTRSFGDVYSAFDLCESLGLNKTDIVHLTAALTLIATNFNSGSRHSDSRAKSAQYRTKLAEEWILEGQTYFELLAGSTKLLSPAFRRKPVVAVALYTLRHQEALARTFWSRAALNDGLASAEAANALVTFLLQTSATAKPTHIYARYVAAAWNAFYESRDITRLVVKDTSSPIRILGTPFSR